MKDEETERQKQTANGSQMPDRDDGKRVEAAPANEGARELPSSLEILKARRHDDKNWTTVPSR